MSRILVTVPELSATAGGLAGHYEVDGRPLDFKRCRLDTPQPELVELLQEYEIVVAGGEQYTADVFQGAPQLRHVARFGVGYDAIDLKAATAHRVAVTTTPGTNHWAVADHAFGLILAIAHGIGRYSRAVRSGVWQKHRGIDVSGKTIGIVGLGLIGRDMVKRAAGFNMTILAHEPEPQQDFVEAHGVELVAFDDLLGRSDFVTLHMPLSAATAGIIDAPKLKLMKPTAYFINTARGALVDEAALYNALSSGSIAGAGLDCFTEEPPEDRRFLELDNVVITPHCASSTDGSWKACGAMVARNIQQFLRGEKPDGLVNADVFATR
jgi:D-3-phosphoglycerate dehydrogenase